jgi:serine/threonine protein phosphatase 1
MSAKFYTHKIQYFSVNQNGKDYVIGDVHGRYDLVYEALAKANFDETKDRLFCVGDLIDRGVYSDHVAEFLSKPYIHAVRGNHEDILLSLYENGTPSEDKIAYIGQQIGLTWWLYTDEDDRQDILEALRRLPLVIEIETVRGTVGLVHADIDSHLNWNQFKDAVENDEEHVIQEALWGRRRLSNNNREGIPGVGRVYVGHTVQDKIKQYGNVVAIDTGAVFNKHLTMVNILAQTQVISNAPYPTSSENVQILQPVGISNEPFVTSSSYFTTVNNKKR